MDNVNTYKVNKEAVKKIAEKVYDNGSTVINRNDLEEMFPELKESEDERIRKALISFLKSPFVNENITDEKVTPWISWLEKQGEKGTIGNEREIPNSAWTEEDDNTLLDTINILRSCGRCSTDRKLWLLSLKNRVQPQPKQEWSEEDEMFVHGLIRGLAAKKDIHGHTTFSSDCIDITETINWLKDLKDRYTWKPSDEQMKLLREVQQALLGKDCHNRFVNFMYELKRLREE